MEPGDQSRTHLERAYPLVADCRRRGLSGDRLSDNSAPRHHSQQASSGGSHRPSAQGCSSPGGAGSSPHPIWRVQVRTHQPGPGRWSGSGGTARCLVGQAPPPTPGGMKLLCFLLESRPASFHRCWQVKVSLSSPLFLKPVETRVQSPCKETHPLLVLSQSQQL